jgi:hypothetical protein
MEAEGLLPHAEAHKGSDAVAHEIADVSPGVPLTVTPSACRYSPSHLLVGRVGALQLSSAAVILI